MHDGISCSTDSFIPGATANPCCTTKGDTRQFTTTDSNWSRDASCVPATSEGTIPALTHQRPSLALVEPDNENPVQHRYHIRSIQRSHFVARLSHQRPPAGTTFLAYHEILAAITHCFSNNTWRRPTSCAVATKTPSKFLNTSILSPELTRNSVLPLWSTILAASP